jgi:hypothetical protein
MCGWAFDLCIIRQIFQHLSNRNIATVLRKARQYSLLVLSDELVVGGKSGGNIDILPYYGTRGLFEEGLKPEAAPFFERVEIFVGSTGLARTLGHTQYIAQDIAHSENDGRSIGSDEV